MDWNSSWCVIWSVHRDFLITLVIVISVLCSWQVISPVETQGEVVVVDELLTVEEKVYDKPTILVAGRVRGEEEIPDGAVGVLTPDMPDILSHVSVRARNGRVIATLTKPIA